MQHVGEMRILLAEEIKSLRDGNTTAANINAVVNATGKYLQTIKMEVEYNRLKGQTPNIKFFEPVKE